MRKISRPAWVLSLLFAGLMLFGGCTADDEPDPSAADQPVTVERVDDTQPARLTLRADAAKRLGIETKPVIAGPAKAGRPATLTVPYAAVVYDAEGQSWAYSAPAPLTFIRVPLVVDTVAGDTATLSSGPAAGTQVVVVGAAELVGAEAGISGEE